MFLENESEAVGVNCCVGIWFKFSLKKQNSESQFREGDMKCKVLEMKSCSHCVDWNSCASKEVKKKKSELWVQSVNKLCNL